MKLGRFVMKWSFQGVGPEISAQDVREKKPRVVLQDYYQPREAKPREVGKNFKTPREGFLGHRVTKTPPEIRLNYKNAD